MNSSTITINSTKYYEAGMKMTISGCWKEHGCWETLFMWIFRINRKPLVYRIISIDSETQMTVEPA